MAVTDIDHYLDNSGSDVLMLKLAGNCINRQ